MVKRLVLKTGNPTTLLDNMHELGKAFYCKIEGAENTYKVVYFAQSREIHFSGVLTAAQLASLSGEATLVKDIRIDEFNDEIIIEE